MNINAIKEAAAAEIISALGELVEEIEADFA